MARKPIVADQFYDSDFDNLQKQITNCFEGKLGPGTLPISKRDGEILGIIVPHAGYFYSGQCAAWAYKEIGEAAMPDLFIILGPDHTGSGSAISAEDWTTPFSDLKADIEFAKVLEATAEQNSGIKINNKAHEKEHSIEVQLPFLQFVNKDHMKTMKMLAIMVSHDVNIKKLAEDIKAAIKLTKKTVCFITSSDFTHYGENFGFTPFIYNIKESLLEMDNGAIETIKKLDSSVFLNYVKKTGATICGTLPIALMIDIIWQDVSDVHLLSYYTSVDITEGKDYSHSVGYAAMVFK